MGWRDGKDRAQLAYQLSDFAYPFPGLFFLMAEEAKAQLEQLNLPLPAFMLFC